MKMKKLTALALAGVLCLGMSTTAFASASPLPEDAVTATNDEGKEVILEQSLIDTESGTFAGWNSKKPESALAMSGAPGFLKESENLVKRAEKPGDGSWKGNLET